MAVKRKRRRTGNARGSPGRRFPSTPKIKEGTTLFMDDPIPLAENTRNEMATAMQENLDEDRYNIPNRRRNGVAGGNAIKFRNDFSRQVYYLTRLGATTEQMAEFFRVSPSTITGWLDNNDDFREANLLGRYIFSMEMIETLSQRAMGYDYTEVEEGTAINRKGELVNVKKIIHKHMPPDPACMFFILKNRHGDVWADTHRGDQAAKLNQEIAKKLEVDELDDDERELLKRIALKKASKMQGQSENE